VTVNTSGRPGKMSKSVEVWTNDPEHRMTMLVIAGEVTPAEKSGSSGGGDCAK